MFHSSGCQRFHDANATDKFAEDRDKTPDKDKPSDPESKGGQFAADRALPEVKAVPFDGKRAMQYLGELCAIGPRISGSAGMTRQQAILQKHFEKYGSTVEVQKFDGKQPSQVGALPRSEPGPNRYVRAAQCTRSSRQKQRYRLNPAVL